MTQPAKVLGAADVRRLLRHVTRHRHAKRNRAMVLLSFKAGLRACEIAGLSWPMVLRPGGQLAPSMLVAGTIAKNGRSRHIPLNPELAVALNRLHRQCGYPVEGPVIRSERGGHMTAGGVVNWFAQIYQELGLGGCSSHSGRRTFITRSARFIPRLGGSLRDVQELAGHRSLTTTERYIEGDRDVQRRLLRLI
ncbi:MAG: integrase/recombinase XerC [Sphingomonadales bacterium]|nr:integrase/recombinase XerC [Sphingomonadales bacterium]